MIEYVTAVSEFIKSVGFPIFVGVYVLVRVETTLSKLSSNIGALTLAIKEKRV